MAEQLKTASVTSVQLDAAVYSDWTVIGADTFDLASHLTTRRNAEHDEAVSLLRFIHSGATHAAVRGRLNTHRTVEGVAGMTVPQSDQLKYWYYKARALQARVLLKRFKGTTPAGFLAQLTSLRGQPRTFVQRA